MESLLESGALLIVVGAISLGIGWNFGYITAVKKFREKSAMITHLNQVL